MTARGRETSITISHSSRFYTLASLPAIAVLLLLFFVPLLIILSKGFVSEGEGSLSPHRRTDS